MSENKKINWKEALKKYLEDNDDAIKSWDVTREDMGLPPINFEIEDKTGSISKELRDEFIKEAQKLKASSTSNPTIIIDSNLVTKGAFIDTNEEIIPWNVTKEDMGIDGDAFPRVIPDHSGTVPPDVVKGFVQEVKELTPSEKIQKIRDAANPSSAKDSNSNKPK